MAADSPERAGTVPPRPADPRLGTLVVGRYRLLARLGAGGMGTVYEAEQLTTRRRVAIKMLQPGLGRIELVRRRFEREAFAASRLDHPHIVGVLDFGLADDGGLFLVMELVRGPTLGDMLDHGRLPAERALLIARQVLQALAHAHAQGIVHRDLKPDNVMILEHVAEAGTSDHDHAKLLDFGIAKLLGEVELEAGDALTQAGVAFGTPEYMAPEQAQGRPVDHRADLYAMGVMIFELMAGRRPFEASDKIALLRLHIDQPPPKLAQVAPDAIATPLLEQLMEKALAKKPEARFQSADEMLAAFDRAALDYLSPVEAAGVARAATETAVVRASTRAGVTEHGLPAALRLRRVRLAALAGGASVAVLVILFSRCGGGRRARCEAQGQVHVGLAQLHAAGGHADEAFDEYERAIAVWPALKSDAQLRADVGALASRARDPDVRLRAREAAEAWGFGERVDHLESFSLDLAQAKTCAERRAAVPRLRALKDKRAIVALRKARAAGEANRCLDRDAREAIEFLEALP